MEFSYLRGCFVERVETDAIGALRLQTIKRTGESDYERKTLVIDIDGRDELWITEEKG